MEDKIKQAISAYKSNASAVKSFNNRKDAFTLLSKVLQNGADVMRMLHDEMRGPPGKGKE
jgi:hypothetical protein